MRGYSPAPCKLFSSAALVLLLLESYVNVVEANLSRVWSAGTSLIVKLFFRIDRNALHHRQTLVLKETLGMNRSREQECRLDQKMAREQRRNFPSLATDWKAHTHPLSLAQPEQRDPFMNWHLSAERGTRRWERWMHASTQCCLLLGSPIWSQSFDWEPGREGEGGRRKRILGQSRR